MTHESLPMIIPLLIYCGASYLGEEKVICPNGWVYLEQGNICIDVKDRITDNFDNHIDRCRKKIGNLGGGLPVISGELSQTEFCSYLKSHYWGMKTTIFLAATDRVQENNFKWVFNNRLVSPYFANGIPFTPGEPNDSNASSRNPQDCLMIDTRSCLWNDYSCNANTVMAPCTLYSANACNINNGNCEHYCIATGIQTRRCVCTPGFKLVANVRCVDIDECTRPDKGGCVNSVCINMVGGWQCRCNNYYQRINHFNCTYIDSCNVKNAGCQHLCQDNNKGAVRCSCMDGYDMNFGTECVKIRRRVSRYWLLLALCSAVLSIISVFTAMESVRRSILGENVRSTKEEPDEDNDHNYYNNEDNFRHEEDYFYEEDVELDDFLEDGATPARNAHSKYLKSDHSSGGNDMGLLSKWLSIGDTDLDYEDAV